MFFFISFTDYDPIDENLKKKTTQLRSPKINNEKLILSNLKKLVFIPKLNDPINFMNMYRNCYGNDVKCDYLVNFIPPNGLKCFAADILKNDFESIRNRFINKYLMQFIEYNHDRFNKCFDDFESIEEYINFKYDYFKLKFDNQESQIIEIIIYSLPMSICKTLVTQGALDSKEKALRLSKIMDTLIKEQYYSRRKEVNLPLVQLAEKEKNSKDSPFHYFESPDSNLKELLINPSASKSTPNSLAINKKKQKKENILNSKLISKKKPGRKSAVELLALRNKNSNAEQVMDYESDSNDENEAISNKIKNLELREEDENFDIY